jgi:hypothetical protein
MLTTEVIDLLATDNNMFDMFDGANGMVVIDIDLDL